MKIIYVNIKAIFAVLITVARTEVKIRPGLGGDGRFIRVGIMTFQSQ